MTRGLHCSFHFQLSVIDVPSIMSDLIHIRRKLKAILIEIMRLLLIILQEVLEKLGDSIFEDDSSKYD